MGFTGGEEGISPGVPIGLPFLTGVPHISQNTLSGSRIAPQFAHVKGLDADETGFDSGEGMASISFTPGMASVGGRAAPAGGG